MSALTEAFNAALDAKLSELVQAKADMANFNAMVAERDTANASLATTSAELAESNAVLQSALDKLNGV